MICVICSHAVFDFSNFVLKIKIKKNAIMPTNGHNSIKNSKNNQREFILIIFFFVFFYETSRSRQTREFWLHLLFWCCCIQFIYFKSKKNKNKFIDIRSNVFNPFILNENSIMEPNKYWNWCFFRKSINQFFLRIKLIYFYRCWSLFFLIHNLLHFIHNLIITTSKRELKCVTISVYQFACTNDDWSICNKIEWNMRFILFSCIK